MIEYCCFFCRLLLSIMALEDQLIKQSSTQDLPNSASSGAVVTNTTAPQIPGTYQRGVPVHSQPLFTTAILTALKQVLDKLFVQINQRTIKLFFDCLFPSL